MEGVLGVLLPEDLAPLEDPLAPRVLTDEPKYIGEPLAAVAAVNETVAQDALEKIQVEYEPLPFVIDPLESLYPGGPAARTQGNVGNRANIELQTLNWTEEDFLRQTEGSAIRRIGYECWLRNIAVALGNAPSSQEVITALDKKKDHSSELVREHIHWALKQHKYQ